MTAWGCRPFDGYIGNLRPPAIPDGDCGPSLVVVDDDDDGGGRGGAPFFTEAFTTWEMVSDKDSAGEIANVALSPVHYQLNAALVEEEEDYSFGVDSEDVPKEELANIPGRAVQKRADCRTVRRGHYVLGSNADSIGIIKLQTSLSPGNRFLHEVRSGPEITTDLDFDSYGYPATESPVGSRPLEPPLWPISSYNIECDSGTYIPPWIPSLPLNRRRRPKHVYFAGSPTHSVHCSEYSVPPYCEVYGEHPNGFEFGPEGERVPTARSIGYVDVFGGFRG